MPNVKKCSWCNKCFIDAENTHCPHCKLELQMTNPFDIFKDIFGKSDDKQNTN